MQHESSLHSGHGNNHTSPPEHCCRSSLFISMLYESFFHLRIIFSYFFEAKEAQHQACEMPVLQWNSFILTIPHYFLHSNCFLELYTRCTQSPTMWASPVIIIFVANIVNMYKWYIAIWFLSCDNWILHIITDGNDILSTSYRYWKRFIFNFFFMWNSIKKVQVLGARPDYRGAFQP